MTWNTAWLIELSKKCDSEVAAEYVVDNSAPSIDPADITLDYHVAWFINVRMLGQRGSGIGARQGTVNHAIADRSIQLSRCIRHPGDSLCGSSQRRWGDQSSTNEEITCPRCAAIVAKHGLSRSIKSRVGAWE